jgi:hypothetical protein
MSGSAIEDYVKLSMTNGATFDLDAITFYQNIT